MINLPDLEKLYSFFLKSTGITTDTRNIATGNIFFALKGEKFNGNLFVEEAFEKGAAYVMVDEIVESTWKEKFGDKFILVDDVLKVLQQLSGFHRTQLKCPVLAITGTNGKTTTKELIVAVFSKKFKTYATKGNQNNHIGIPITLLSIQNDAEFVIIEMGANHQGEIASYCEYVQPDYGLITNVGLAHLEGFGGFEEVVKAKTELYRDLNLRGGKLFVNTESEQLNYELQSIDYKRENIVTYGQSSSAFCNGEIIPDGDFLKIKTEEGNIQTNLVGDYNFENVICTVCVGKYFGIEKEKIKEAIESYYPANNRSQKISYGSNTIILDAYNANPSSMTEALKNFEKMIGVNIPSKEEARPRADQSVVILGEMMELGEYSEAEHEKIAAAVESDNWEKIKKVFVGKGFEIVRPRSNQGWLWFENTDDLKKWFWEQKFENSYILIKGSRKNELEKILKD